VLLSRELANPNTRCLGKLRELDKKDSYQFNSGKGGGVPDLFYFSAIFKP
jgi:hypothetical protein